MREPRAPRVSLAGCRPRAGAGCARTPPPAHQAREDLDIGPELLEGCGDHLPVYGRLVGYKGPHASRAGIWPRPLGGTSRPYGTWLNTPAPSSSIVWIVEMPRLWNFVDPHVSSARRAGRSGRPRLSLDRYHAVAHGEDERLQSGGNLELGEDVSHVGVNRSHAHV